jgi:hypothetical protein
MTNVRRACLWVFCCLAVSVSTGSAQTEPVAPSGPPPAHISLIEGQVYVDRDGRSEPAVANLPLLDGDRLRTEEGRLEVILPDGSLLHVDWYSTIDVLAADLLRVLRGRVYIVVRGARDAGLATRYQLDTPIASMQTGGPGEFRVSVVDGEHGTEVELAVVRGQATLANDLGAQDVRAGERAIVREGLAASAPQYFNSARWDAFDRWSAQRRDERLGTVSGQYLPADLEVYASTFDQYGTWRNDPNDGAVWYPSVGVDWRPYSVGYWRSYPVWGSFWIGNDPWGWPTHHYGRWGFSGGFGWYWMPARVWGPAWVHWAVSPGYVSWCALGRSGYPVFAHFGLRGSYYGNHVDAWRGWTVIPRQHFGSGIPVHRVAVDGHRIDGAARGAFAVQRNGPATGSAVRRGSGGGTSAPRNSPGIRQPGLGTRDAPARVLRGGPPSPTGTATRRSFSTTNLSQTTVPRTEAPPATPDATAFRSRRDQGVRQWTAPGGDTPAGAENRDRARALPDSMRSVAPPPTSEPGSLPRWGGWPDSGQSAPSVLPHAYDAPSPTPTRRNPYVRDGGGAPDSSGRSAYPRTYDAPAQTPNRDIPYFRGSSAGVPDGSARPRTPERTVMPQNSQPRPSAPAWQGPRPGSPEASPGQASRPRDGGSGMPAGQASRRGASPGASSPSSAPRYNPGSGAPHPRSGGNPPPPRGRGGAPD